MHLYCKTQTNRNISQDMSNFSIHITCMGFKLCIFSEFIILSVNKRLTESNTVFSPISVICRLNNFCSCSALTWDSNQCECVCAALDTKRSYPTLPHLSDTAPLPDPSYWKIYARSMYFTLEIVHGIAFILRGLTIFAKSNQHIDKLTL